MADNDIVISGMSGRFPESNNIDELAKNIFAGVDMVTESNGRFTEGYLGINTRSGKIKDLNSFDANFFKLDRKLAELSDPQSRILLEVTYEAIIDAGINPNSLRGTRTGVYVGHTTYPGNDGLRESLECDLLNKKILSLTETIGRITALLANRISFVFDFKGPSLMTDTACSSSLTALNLAFSHLQTGQADYAIVAGTNLNLQPFYMQIFQEFRMCSPRGIPAVMDESADGFVKSDTISCVLLQRRSTAKRVYATILTSRVNIDGRKKEGIYSPASKTQEELMVMAYKEAGIDPLKLTLVEGHLTGTKVGDPIELRAIYNAYCSRPGRTEVLPISSLKSSTGHSEAASGMASIIKVILCYETETIPPNIHLNEINKNIEELCPPLYPNIELLKYEPGMAAINNFGIGGANANVLIEPNYKLTNEDNLNIADTIPRIINVCGRTEDTVNHVLDYIEHNPKKITKDFLALLSDSMKNVFNENTNGFPFKGSVIIKKLSEHKSGIEYEYKRQTSEIKSGSPRPVCFLFPGLGGQWTAMAKALMPIKIFADKVEECHQILLEFGIDLKDLLLSDETNAISTMTPKFCATTSIEIALFEVLKALDITPDIIIGHSFGEIACAYADGCLTTREAMAVTYFRGFVTETEDNIGTGLMAVCALSKNEAQILVPPEVVIACFNGQNTVVLSGPKKPMKQLIESLKQKNIFCYEMDSNGIAYHSKYLKNCTEPMTDYIKYYLGNPKIRSDKWISTSILEKEPKDEILKYASAEYFVYNLINPVNFYHQLKTLPSNTIVVELCSDEIFKKIVGETLDSASYLSLMKKDSNDTNLDYFLSSITTLYGLGLNPSIENLYPKVEFPVSRGTPSISSLMKWDHSVKYPVRLYPQHFNKSIESDYNVIIDLNEPDDSFYEGHQVDGLILFPATGYLMLAWRALAAVQGKTWNEVPVVFEDVQFKRAVHLTNENKCLLKVLYDRKLGNFTIVESESICCFGKMRSPPKDCLLLQTVFIEKHESILENEFSLSEDDIYKEFQIMGYNFSGEFRKLKKIRTNDFKHFLGVSSWSGNMVTFLDSLCRSTMLGHPLRKLVVPIMIKAMRIDPKVLLKAIAQNKCEEDNKDCVNIQLDEETLKIKNELQVISDVEKYCFFRSELPFYYDLKCNQLVAPGFEMERLITSTIARKAETKNLILDSYEFVSNDDNNAIEESDKTHKNEYLQVCKSMAAKVKQLGLKDIKCDFNHQILSMDVIEKYRNQNNEQHIIFKIFDKLDELLKNENNSDVKTTDENIQSIFNELQDSNSFNLGKDLVNNISNNERLIRSLTDIVSENNVTKRELKVTEINLSSELFIKEVKKNISYFESNQTVVDYQIIVESLEGINEGLHDHCKVWNSEEDLPINTSDLIILRDTQHIWELSLQNLFKQIYDSLNGSGFLLIVAKYHMTEPEVALNSILGDNYINDSDFDQRLNKIIKTAQQMGLHLIANKCDSISTKALLFRKIVDKKDIPTNDRIIEIKSDRNKKWFQIIKEKLINSFDEYDDNTNVRNVWLIANDSNINGIIGLFNCLRLEPGGHKMRCIFDLDQKTTLPIDWNSKPFSDILCNDLSINVIKDGKLGTYRHLRLPKDYDKTVSNEYFLNITRIGDLSSLQWFDGKGLVEENESFRFDNKRMTKVHINIYYSGLIFHDVMLATGRFHDKRQHLSPNSIIGWEYAGRRADTGERVMGFKSYGCLASSINENMAQMTAIPKHWSMEDSVTVLMQYLTVWYALIERADIKRGESILIHSGTGGTGQAAINVCKHYECDIFITVGTEEKKQFLIKEYNIPENRIFSSRDIQFKYKIQQLTDGKGVDIVLNSLENELLDASFDCLADSGRFIELGKSDFNQNKQMGTYDFLRDISLIGVNIDLCLWKKPEFALKFFDWMHRNATNDCVKHLNRKVFETNEVEKAFRYMTTGKHIGKTVIKIRDEENIKMPLINIVPAQSMIVKTKTFFNPNKVYIITGGLGGVGMELVNWMSNKRAKNFVLTSRSGFKTDYQKYVINRMIKFGEDLKYLNVKIHLSKEDCLTVESTRRLIYESLQFGQIGGLFHSTLVLNDSLIENMTFEMFCQTIDAKHKVFDNLDVESRKLGYNLDYFVVFSTLASGKGNAGQTNHAFGSSLCERICEQRRRDGLHGLAIQYGPIDDVGAFGRSDQVLLLSSLKKQRILSCCDVLDKLLAISQPVVTSYVTSNRDEQTGNAKKGLIQNLWHALGIDSESTPDHMTLNEIGMESLLVIELQQKLERVLGIKYTTKEIRNLSVGSLKEYDRKMTSTLKK